MSQCDKMLENMLDDIIENLEKYAKSDFYDKEIDGSCFNDVLDIEYRIGSDYQYRSIKLCLAWGGPNIYLDTNCNQLIGYWDTTITRYLDTDLCDAIDEYWKSIWTDLY